VCDWRLFSKIEAIISLFFLQAPYLHWNSFLPFSDAAGMDLQQLMRFSNFPLHTQRAWSGVEKLESYPRT